MAIAPEACGPGLRGCVQHWMEGAAISGYTFPPMSDNHAMVVRGWPVTEDLQVCNYIINT